MTADMNSTVSSGTPRHSSMKPIEKYLHHRQLRAAAERQQDAERQRARHRRRRR